MARSEVLIIEGVYEKSIENDNINEVKLRQKIRDLEKQLDRQNRTIQRICHRLNLKYKP